MIKNILKNLSEVTALASLKARAKEVVPNFTKLILVIVAMTLLQTPIFAQKVAMLIGVGNIKNNPLNTDLDLETMKSLLGDSYDKIITLKDNQATYNNVKNTLIDFYSLKSTDTLLFYYTGHGSRAYGGFEEKDKKDEFLMLSGYNIKYPNIITNRVMIDDEFNYHFSKIKAKKIILYDCCHSQTQNKGLSSNKRVIKSMETVFKLKQPKNQTYLNAKMSNYIKLSACLDEEEAEDSLSGGIFTLTLKYILEKNSNISFDNLIKEIKNNLVKVANKYDRAGNFTPNLSSDLLSPKNFKTGDAFAIKLDNKSKSLEEFLNSRMGGFEFKIHSNKKEFRLYEDIILTSSHKSDDNYLYMIEVKNEKYKLITQKKLSECTNQKCIFRDIISSKPLGRSNIYLISTQKPLHLVGSLRDKNLVESLKSQLKHQSFKVQKVWFDTIDE